MRKHPNSTKDPERERPAKSLKKGTWACSRNQGEAHEFSLSFPPYLGQLNVLKGIRSGELTTPLEYYASQDAKESPSKHTVWYARTRYWKCLRCGCSRSDSEERQDRRIRQSATS